MTNQRKPNVVIIYADDLGYGDLSCYGAQEVQTPNIDGLLEHGVRFTNGYSTSAVCTPARYSLLTGEYPFRNPDTHILQGNAASIISKEQFTLPKLFRSKGYRTGIVGKWHLGLGEFAFDWNGEIPSTLQDVGFDYSFIFPATNDRVPCVYLENGRVVNLDLSDPINVSYEGTCPFDGVETYEKHPECIRMQSSHGHNQSVVNGVGRIGYMKGGTEATWKDEELAETFLEKSMAFIDESESLPFFLYYALHQPHVPRLSSERFAGATDLGPRGDVIAELDWCVGMLTEHLEKAGLLEDTIIIFSSDNGPVLDDGYKDDAVLCNGVHAPAGPLRGGKYSKFDGGARIPLIISWKDKIIPRSSDALLCQVDFLASFAKMLEVDLQDNQAVDSECMLKTMLGGESKSRKEILYEGVGKGLVLRQGKWICIPPQQGDWINRNTDTELGNSLDPQLYNMDYDMSQGKNVAREYPQILAAMQERIQEIRSCKKSR